MFLANLPNSEGDLPDSEEAVMKNFGDYFLWYSQRGTGKGWSLLSLDGVTVQQFGESMPDDGEIASIISAFEAIQ